MNTRSHNPTFGQSTLRACWALCLAVTLGLTVHAQNTPPAPVPDAAAAENAQNSTPPAPASPEETALDPLNPDQLKRYSIDRYEKIIKKSPFAFKIEQPPPAATVSFAADLVLAGFTIDSGKGVTYASIVDKKANKRFVIRTGQPSADGIELVQLNRGQTLLESAVVARKGAEEATIKSDKEVIKRPAVVNAAVVGQPGQNANVPGRPGQPGANNLNLSLNPRGANPQQQQINGQLQAPQAGGQGQAASLPPGAVNNGGAPPGAQATQAQPQGQQQRPAQGQGRRRVILPPQN